MKETGIGTSWKQRVRVFFQLLNVFIKVNLILHIGLLNATGFSFQPENKKFGKT